METPKKLEELRVQIFSDGAGAADMFALAQMPYIKGFTTNPTLMREAGVENYESFAHEILAKIPDKSISFEVFSDDFTEMERQARLIHAWGENVFVKIPSMNTRGESSAALIKKLTDDGINVNATMIIAPAEIRIAADALSPKAKGYISVFAGRAADAGVDPLPIMRDAKTLLRDKPHISLLWASTRELFNIYQAEEAGADIITVPPSILKKIPGIGTSLETLTHEGVQRFYDDGVAAGYSL
ncbi:MAG: transaldolase [Minisyncoccia bacterium]